jgi:hypothetical protein
MKCPFCLVKCYRKKNAMYYNKTRYCVYFRTHNDIIQHDASISSTFYFIITITFKTSPEQRISSTITGLDVWISHSFTYPILKPVHELKDKNNILIKFIGEVFKIYRRLLTVYKCIFRTYYM